LQESPQFLEYATKFAKNMGKVKGFWRWVYLCVTGIATGLVAVSIQYLLHHAFDLQYQLQNTLAESGQSLWVRYAAWTGIKVCLAGIAGILVCYVQPLAAGSGIPEIKCYLNGVDVPGVLQFRTLVAKAVGIVFSVASGLPCGKEGPMIHSGAVIGSLMSGLRAGPLPGPFAQNPEARDMTAAGAAAGVAAAFGAPIGGVLFAVEEGASHMNPRILVRTFVCASLATLTVRVFLGRMEGLPWGALGTDVPVEFERFHHARSYLIWELPIFALIGIAGGLFGAAFNQLNVYLSLWRKRHVGPRGHKRFFEVLFVSAVIASVSFWVPLIAGDATEREHFSSGQLLFAESGNISIKHLLHRGHPFDPKVLVLFFFTHFCLACWTYGLGVPSGLFVPSLLAGAALGRLTGQLLEGHVQGEPGVYALIGATSFLSGMARITISLAVILMETTGEAEWCLPVFVAVMAAKWTGDKFNKGLYDIHIGLKSVPLLEHFPEKEMLEVKARDVMSHELCVLESKMEVRKLLDVLKSCDHHGFPVLRCSSSEFVGLVERSTLHHLLAHGKEHGVLHDTVCDQDAAGHHVMPLEAMARHGYPSFPSYTTVESALEDEDMGKVIDLLPYTNPGCYTVTEDTVMARCFMLFRTMGLRHLPVLSEDRSRLQGILTRKDLIFNEGAEDRATARKPTSISSWILW
jgi:chloride channel 7